MVSLLWFFVVISTGFLFSCSSVKRVSEDDHKVDFNFILVNDVYEIAPLSNGSEGGVARVAALKKMELQNNRNSFLLLAGDFLSPSVYNSLQYNGKPVRGKQMVEVLNAAGLDLAVFGNHEFDIKESELEERINESSFQWFSSNTFHKQNQEIKAFQKEGSPLPKTFVLNISDKDGTRAKIGFISVTLPFNKADYVTYTDALSSAKQAYTDLKDSVDAVVALTHQTLEDDRKLAKEIPGLAIILGGHEHDMRFEKTGNIYIAKAHSNAKSAFVVKLLLNKKKNKVKAKPKLVYLNKKIPFDSATNAVVEKWTSIAEKSFGSIGFSPKRVIVQKGDPLDGRDVTTRTGKTNLTKVIVNAMKDAVPGADVVMMNSGAIRVDDVLGMPLTEYDILRTLPFGGGIREADMRGSLLIRILESSEKNRGSGGYLQYNESIRKENEIWKLDGVVIDAAKIYKVALSDFLFTGKEANLGFLHPSNAGIVKAYEPVNTLSDPRSDIRLAVIRYLDKIKP